jgi:hypothetical protein
VLPLPLQSDGEEGDREEDGSDVDKSYEVQFAMSPEPPEQEEGEEPTTAEGSDNIMISLGYCAVYKYRIKLKDEVGMAMPKSAQLSCRDTIHPYHVYHHVYHDLYHDVYDHVYHDVYHHGVDHKYGS